MKPAVSRPRVVIAALAPALTCAFGGCGSRKRLDFGTIANVDGRDPTASTDTSSTATSVTATASQVGGAPAVPTGTAVTPEPSRREPVSGKLIDFWGHPVPDVDLDVGGVRAVSAADGTFEAQAVEGVYDLSFVVHIEGEATETYGWTYQGLTERTPVLQVFRGLPPRRATVRLNLPFSDGETLPCGSMALGGEHGHQAFGIFQASTPVSVVWRGVDPVPLNVHALFWAPSATGECNSPAQFLGWRQHEVALSAGDDVTLGIGAAAGSNSALTDAIAGVVQSDQEGALKAALFLRFANGATLPVATREVDNGVPFSFAVPVVDDTTLIVAGSRAGISTADSAVEYTSVSASDLRDVELLPPATPTLVQPADAARLSAADAVFEWKHDGTVAMLVVTQEDRFTTQFVITASERTRLPDLSHLGLVLQPDVAHGWDVEIHRQAPTVDEWLETAFPLDAFSIDFATPIGPQVTAGRFARSPMRSVTFSAE